MGTLKKILNIIYNCLKKNILIITFILTSLFSSILVRYYTLGNYLAVKPILTDLSFLLVISFFGYLLKIKNQFKFFLVWSIILVFICILNTVYYGNYISFASVSLLKTAGELTGYTDAIFENILELKDFIYLLQIFIIYFIHIQLKRQNFYKDEKTNLSKKKTIICKFVFGTFTILFLILMLLLNGINRLNQQWNRNSIVRDFGIYVYQANDVVSSIKTKVSGMLGYDSAYKVFREYYESTQQSASNNKYTNLFEGKNVIVIHGESIQGFTMNLSFNGKELTPNLNKMAKEGIYFSNFYSQESVGNSSDTEFTSLSSLLPSSSGTVFVNYFNRDYETILKLLKEKDYYTFSMHANNGSAWNRNVTYKYLGYDDFYYHTKDYEIDEVIGLGLSDKSFFRQSVNKIKKINDEHNNFYGTLVMLTNHTPFSDTDSFEYSVDIKNVNEETKEETITPWLEDTKVGNYLKSVNYADSAIGYLFELLEEEKLLDNTVIVLYGDHDAKLKRSELNKLFMSEYYEDSLIDKENRIDNLDDFTYELNRKVPFIIWSKDIINTSYSAKIDDVMGMIDVAPTLENMLGVKAKYALGHDIFSIDDNVVVFPSGNWMTNKIYYNSSKNEFRQLNLDYSIDFDYIEHYNKYAEELINISNGIITYDLIKAYETGEETLSN